MNLSKEDINQINYSITLSSFIEKLYEQLYNLEIDGKKETKEYNRLIGILKLQTDLEKKYYEKINLDYQKAKSWYGYLLVTHIKTNNISEIDSIINQDYSKRHIKRVLNNLLDIILSNPKNLIEKIPEDVYKSIEQLDIEDVETILSNSLDKSVSIERNLEKDVYNTFLCILEEFINNSSFNSIKNELLKVKYNLSFIYTRIEQNLLNNNFTIFDDVYSESKLTADIKEVEKDYYLLIKDKFCNNICLQELSSIVNISDIDYQENKIVIISILKQCFIRASMAYMSEFAIEKIIEDFYRYSAPHIKNDISLSIVNDCFNKSKKDKTKIKIISLYQNF